MNGVSHMLPFVIGGGILIALAFLFDDYSIDPANFGMNTPFAAFLKTVGGTAFDFMLPILAGYIAMSIGDRPALAVGFVGGMLANKGGSGFLGALIAGFVAGYLIVGLKKLFEKLPNSLEGLKPVLLYPFLGILLIGAIIMFVINPPVAALNTGITNVLNNMGESSKILLGAVLGGMMAFDMGGPLNKAAYVFGTASLASGITNVLNNMGESSKILLGAVLGGMMAFDMGGPLNKAAYVFGTASLASGQFEFMAAVMIGGMVPPLAIALCTTFFKKKFTAKERQSAVTNYIMGLSQFEFMAAVMIGGMVPPLAIALCTTFFKKKFTAKERQSAVTNYIMGLSFITEGAIPFAAADPLRVIPACVVGSATAGALSMAFGCALRAPHGGIFVLPVITNPLGYFGALVIGSLVGMIVLAILKKNKK